MMFLLALLLATADPAPAPPPTQALPLAELPPQKLARGSCALVLWDKASRRRVAMATREPTTLRIVHNGVLQLLAATDAGGLAVAGFAPEAGFAGGGVRLRWQLAIESVAGGGIVRDGSLALTLADGTEIVTPVAGLIGCS